MITITTEQMHSWQAGMEERFIRDIDRFIETKCDLSRPHDRGMPPLGAERVKQIRQLVDRARGFGIKGQLATVQFAILGLGYSSTFDQIPRVKQMLRDQRRTPDENMQAVMNAVVEAESRELR